MIEYLGIFAALMELLAIYLLGRKMTAGWWCGMIGNMAWCWYVFGSGTTYGLLLVCLPAFVLNIKGWREWSNGKED